MRHRLAPPSVGGRPLATVEPFQCQCERRRIAGQQRTSTVGGEPPVPWLLERLGHTAVRSAAVVATGPPVVFAGVAAAFVVWDVGATAADLGRTVGPDAPTQRGEFVHAAASVLVGAAAVGLTWVALFAVGPLTAAVPRWRATLSLALALSALVAFGLALTD